MLQVNPVNRPDIKEVLTGLEAIAIAMDVDLKGKVVSHEVTPILVNALIRQCAPQFTCSTHFPWS